MRIDTPLLLLANAVLLSACAGKGPPADVGSMAAPGGERADSAYDAQADLIRTAGSDRIFFDFDSSALDDEDRGTLRRQASWLAQYPDATATIEGHCDERGTREYNLALGERRANSAKNFLAASGISPDRLSVVSYGKERPDAIGSNEQAWARNRRAVTVVIRR